MRASKPVDDDRDGRERVVLAHEPGDGYGAGYYETCLVRAVPSVLAPLVRHDVADVLRTAALADLAERYCGRSDFSLKSLTPSADG